MYRVVFRCCRSGNQHIVVLPVKLQFQIRVRDGFLSCRFFRSIGFPFLFEEERNAGRVSASTTTASLSAGRSCTTSTATSSASTAAPACPGSRLLRQYTACYQ